MKVYIIGSHSTGKTTIARYISQTYNLPLVPECARIILAEKELQIDSLRSNLDVVDSYQRDIFKRQIEEEKKLQDNFVSDRSFDCLCYTAEYSRIAKEIYDSQEYQNYIESLKKDDVYIFFVRPSKATLKQDGVRETLDWDAVTRIDAMSKLLLELHGLKHYQISMSSMQERAHFIDAILNNIIK